jgi:hypothetical protein
MSFAGVRHVVVVIVILAPAAAAAAALFDFVVSPFVWFYDVVRVLHISSGSCLVLLECNGGSIIESISQYP